MTRPIEEKAITLVWTGASGALYGLRLLQCLLQEDYEVSLLISAAARVVLATEQGLKLSGNPQKAQTQVNDHIKASSGKLTLFGKEDWFSPVASGSAAPKTMVICPCSMGSLAAIAHGSSDNLIERAADVVIKEKGQLLLVVRETPLSSIHLENMLKLSQIGVVLMPASPGFYHRPRSVEDVVDFVVARVLDHIGVTQKILPRWGYKVG